MGYSKNWNNPPSTMAKSFESPANDIRAFSHGSLLNHYERKEDSKSVKKIKEKKSRTYKAKMAEAEYTPVTRKKSLRTLYRMV